VSTNDCSHTLNNHSTLAEVAGMLRNLTARYRSVGISFDCVFGYVSGVVTGCERYLHHIFAQVAINIRLLCCGRCEPDEDAMWCRHRMTVLVCATAFCDSWKKNWRNFRARDLSVLLTRFQPQIFHLQIESQKFANWIESKISWTPIKSSVVKSNPLTQLNCNLNRIAIGTCPSLNNKSTFLQS